MKPSHHNISLRNAIYSILIILISFLWFFSNIPIVSNNLHDIENKTYDLLFITRHSLKLNPKTPRNILIVGIDATSINKVGVPWPWPRQFHAALLDALNEAGVKLVIYDIIFDTISPLSLQTQDVSGEKVVAHTSFDAGKEDDEIFAKSLAASKNVILACEAEPLSKTKFHSVLPVGQFLNALNHDVGFLGNSSVTYDRDNFVRTAKIIYPELKDTSALSISLALRAAQKCLNTKAKILENNIVEINKKKIPSNFLINYYGPSETITTIPYWKALELIYSNKGNIFKDKIVFIGRTKLKASIDPFRGVRSPDSFPTPFTALTPNFSGVEIQGTILANILDGSYIVKTNNFITLLIFFLVGIISNFVVSKLRQKLVFCFYICLLISIIYVYISFLCFTFLNLAIPTTYPTYGIILPIYFINFLDQYFFVDSSRRRQAKIFRQLVPLQIADEIEKMDQETLALGGTKRKITILFADIKNFTGLCEKNPPEIVVSILNKFFTEMVTVIHKHEGLVDKFIGDAIMAIWGSPKILDGEAQATLATKCALSMSQELKKLNELWHRTGLHENLQIRIGLNTAEAITGNVGSPERMQFSAIGDGVNVAARLEAVNKVYGTSILMSDNTAKLINSGFYKREIDRVLVPGRDTPIDIYELINPENYNQDLLNLYSTGLKNYRNKNFDEAINNWQKCITISTADSPSIVMLQRTIKIKQGLLTSPLPSDWQPIWTIENK